MSELESRCRETGTGLESEQVLQIKFPYETVYGSLAMLAHAPRPGSAGRRYGCSRRHLCLDRQQFARFLQRHESGNGGYLTSKSLSSRLATGTFLSWTYCGMPFL